MITLQAPAKINLTLEILARRPDGYHTLRSVMVPVGLYDEIALEPAAKAEFTCEPGGLEADNLVTRALEAARVSDTYAVTLRKRIPVGGGLGGGSSDAAAILRAAMRDALPHGEVDWLAAARSLGSDVPFFLTGTGALVEGTGERLTALGRLPPWWALIAAPAVAVSTAHAYGMLDASRSGAPEMTRPRSSSVSLEAVDALQRADFAALRGLLSNDFHALVVENVPGVRRAYEAMAAAGAPDTLLSGSGSCLFALFEREALAREVAAKLDASAFAGIFTAPLVSDDAWR